MAIKYFQRLLERACMRMRETKKGQKMLVWSERKVIIIIRGIVTWTTKSTNCCFFTALDESC